MYARVIEGIYVSNALTVKNLKFLSDADVTAIINLSGKELDPIEDVDIFNFIIPSQELLDAEIPKTLNKLETISQVIGELRKNHRTVLVCCDDGKNKCMLVAGYYHITHCGAVYLKTIEQLELLYCTTEQKTEEQTERIKFANDPGWYDLARSNMTPAELLAMNTQRVTRRNLLCLTMASFRKTLRIAGGAKK